MGGEVIRRYHRDTSFGPLRWPQPGVPGFVPMDPGNRPRPFKRYPQARVRVLPSELTPGGAPAVTALSGRAPVTDPDVDLEMLARLLYLSAGVTRTAGPRGRTTWFRAAPSAGNLHPLEAYVATGAMAGLDAGLYHFAPDAYALEELSAGDHRPVLSDAAAAPEVATSPVVLVVTGIPWRTAWKYGERGLRHVYWDAGAALANLLTVAQAYGLRARILLGFVDSTLSRQVGIDGVTEFPVAVVTVGAPGRPVAAGPHEPAPALSATPLSPRPIEFPLVTRAQHAGDLATPDEVAAWRSAAPAGLPPAQDAVKPPAQDAVDPPAQDAVDPPADHSFAPAGSEPIESVLRRRGSTRRMRRGAAPTELLRWGMAVATRQVPTDAVPAGASLLSHELAVHGVRGVEPGLYHWAGGGPRPYRPGPEHVIRRLSCLLCLEQELGGDSAYTDFACADLDRVLDGYGDRGYRVAQLEAGVAAERLQLAAFALGHGGTGLTFCDEEISAEFDTRAACMLAVAIGIPAYRARPGGEPGRPTRLTW